VKRLGIQGGSNGGLLVGNMVTLYPELFSAAVCQVPLLDMKRYHLLLAGASWAAEYGDLDVASGISSRPLAVSESGSPRPIPRGAVYPRRHATTGFTRDTRAK